MRKIAFYIALIASIVTIIGFILQLNKKNTNTINTNISDTNNSNNIVINNSSDIYVDTNQKTQEFKTKSLWKTSIENAKYYINEKNYEKAIEISKNAINIAKKRFGLLSIELEDSYAVCCNAQYLNASYKKAIKSCLQAYNINQKKGFSKDTVIRLGRELNQLVRSYIANGNFIEAEKYNKIFESNLPLFTPNLEAFPSRPIITDTTTPSAGKKQYRKFLDEVLLNRSIISMSKKEYISALFDAKQARDIRIHIYGKLDESVGEANLLISTIKAQINEINKLKSFKNPKLKRFKYSDSGHLLDTKTNLIWSRCPFGEEWKNNECIGHRKYTDYRNAKTMGMLGLQNDSLKPSRLPTLEEISKLLMINKTLLSILIPSIKNENYWIYSKNCIKDSSFQGDLCPYIHYNKNLLPSKDNLISNFIQDYEKKIVKVKSAAFFLVRENE